MRPIPPPCPVDDAPHTTCTSPDYAGVARAPIVIVQLPGRDAVDADAVTLPIATPQAQTPQDDRTAPIAPAGGFTTAGYRRALHKPSRGRG